MRRLADAPGRANCALNGGASNGGLAKPLWRQLPQSIFRSTRRTQEPTPGVALRCNQALPELLATATGAAECEPIVAERVPKPQARPPPVLPSIPAHRLQAIPRPLECR